LRKVNFKLQQKGCGTLEENCPHSFFYQTRFLAEDCTKMRIRKISIKQWRNFENVEFQLDDNAGLVCVVGANGTGKSHLLELIAACAHRLGLTPGIEIPRGNPFADPHDFSLQFYLSHWPNEMSEVQ
jgi:ABC-type uncharacterized transport system ATPase subunit